jgi:type I restriction enzyme S subunit
MYELLNAPYIAWLDSLTYGTKMPRVSPEQVAVSPVGLPPPAEQRAIAAFLDRETVRIDELVAKNERLIALLQEQRTALITRAVTKGLDPTVRMKDSGVEWLGEIPAHWEMKPLRQVIETLMDFRGRTPTKIGMDWGGEVPAISAVNVREGYLDLSRGVNYGSQDLHDRWMVQGPTRRGDVLFTTEAPLGNVSLVPDDNQYILSQRVVLLRPHPSQLMSEYLHRLLMSSAFQQGVEVLATGSTAEGVKRRYLMAMPVCVPQLQDQRAIAAFLERETTRIDALIAKVRDAIDRLKELRTALISAAVTGKIDVGRA